MANYGPCMHADACVCVLHHDLLAITDGNALQVLSVTADVTAPKISTATVDLAQGTAVITFGEPVDKTLTKNEQKNDT